MTEETKTSPAVSPVADIRIKLDTMDLLFSPQDDISGKETALIFQMFFNAVFHKTDTLIDFGSFIAKHNLQKHFVEIKDEPKEGQETA